MNLHGHHHFLARAFGSWIEYRLNRDIVQYDFCQIQPGSPPRSIFAIVPADSPHVASASAFELHIFPHHEVSFLAVCKRQGAGGSALHRVRPQAPGF